MSDYQKRKPRNEVDRVATNDSGLRDEVAADLNGSSPEPDYGPQPDPIPDRPADGAVKAKWLDYCMALGADRDFLEGNAQHFDSDAEVTRTIRVPVNPLPDSDPDYYEDLGSVVDASIDQDESADDFAARMRAFHEAAREQRNKPETEIEYREETVTERGGYVQSKALSRDELIDLADRLGG